MLCPNASLAWVFKSQRTHLPQILQLINAIVTKELPLFPSWITASYALKYVSFVEGTE